MQVPVRHIGAASSTWISVSMTHMTGVLRFNHTICTSGSHDALLCMADHTGGSAAQKELALRIRVGALQSALNVA